LKRFQIVALKLKSIQESCIAVNQEGRQGWTASSHRQIAAPPPSLPLSLSELVAIDRISQLSGRRIAEKT
jgi:hypothetical protein